MKSCKSCACFLVLALAFAVPQAMGQAAQAAEDPAPAKEAKSRTLEGKIVCAKCALAEKGRKECQNVLVVEGQGKSEQFYLTKNAVYEKFGEVCQGSPKVRVTGEVTTADGKTWLTPSQIENIDKG